MAETTDALARKEHVIDTPENDNTDDTKQIDDIKDLPKTDKEVIEKPFNEILKTIEEKPEETVEVAQKNDKKREGKRTCYMPRLW